MRIGTQDSIELEEAPCPLCGSAERLRFLKGQDNLYGVPGEFRLVRCRQCRHVYMNPRPTLDAISHCYPAGYGPHQARVSSEAGSESLENGEETVQEPGPTPWYLSPWARRIPGLRRFYYWLADSKSEFIPESVTSSQRALEIGCSTGKFLVRLRNQGWEAQGVELAEEPARQAAEQQFDVHVGTLASASFPDASFDAVFAWMVIEHLREPAATIEEIHRILKPGGSFVFSVPNFACWERPFFGRYWHALELPRHLQHFTPRSIKSLLGATGFNLQQVIHQRNLLNVVLSLGILLRHTFPNSRLGQRLIDFTDDPTMWWQLALAPVAKFLAFIHQGGRLTVVARRRDQVSFSARSSS